MEFSSFFFYLLFFSAIFQLSNSIVSSAKVEISTQNAPTDKLDSLTKQMDEKDADSGKRLVQQRMKRDTDDDMGDNLADDNEDVVYIDHRQSGCLPEEPRNQGDCRASYAFATIAFYEWLNCKKTRGFQAFSEQYIIDCSHRYGNFGCDGGEPVEAVIFANERGLVLRENYPYTGEQGDCLYDDSIPSRNIGSLRVIEPLVTYIPLYHQTTLEEHLKHGPIILMLEVNPDFLSYTGGVDDNVGHDTELLHTMLLIGHGREDGKEYWLFRNSLSTTFGGNEFGHYKLNKNVDCLRGLSGYGLEGPLSG